MADTERDDQDVDPVEFARAMLGISPEDAETVRERTSPTRPRGKHRADDDDELPRGQHGPTADYGDDT